MAFSPAIYVAMAEKQFKPHKLLRDFREALGLSQVAFGREASMHAVLVAQIEIGDKRMGAKIAQRVLDRWPKQAIAAGLNLDVLYRFQQDVEAP